MLQPTSTLYRNADVTQVPRKIASCNTSSKRYKI